MFTRAIIKVFLALGLILSAVQIKAQIQEPVKFQYLSPTKEVKVGDVVELSFQAKIDKGWYLYSNDFAEDLGPLLTEFKFKKDASYELIGKKPTPVGAKKKFDDLWGGEYTYFTSKATFTQKIKVKSLPLNVSGEWEGQSCTEIDGKCIPVSGDFQFTDFVYAKNVKAETANKPAKESASSAEASPETNGANAPPAEVNDSNTVTAQPKASASITDINYAKEVEGAEENTVWGFFWIAFLSGLVALLTPCVFPMIPMTVSFFTKQSNNKAKAIFFGASIVGIYTILGSLLARFNGPEAANFLATHWIPNLLFFAIFVVFGVSFLGAFEIVLPSKWVNAADRQADKGGFYGVFFMAFTLALVSFSCTGPIVGVILVQSAGGEIIKPVMGMLGFSLAFAIPFTFFAFFPSMLNSLPRSGGWLNSVKVVLGFIELALALKFLSIADQAYHWNILDREVFLALWIVIFSLNGFYLLGKLQLSHDSPVAYISVSRIMFAIANFAFVVYLVPGLWGAPLKALAGYLPPETTLDFNLMRSNSGAADNTSNNLCEPPKYADFLELPHEIKGYFDLKQANKCSKELNKPIFIDFTGHGCVNCREMEARVWSDPEILKILKEEFIVTALYVDDKTELPEADWYTSTYDKKVKKTIGKQNADYQIMQFNNNAQPLYIIQDAEGKLLNTPRAYNLDKAAFLEFLKKGLENYKTLHPKS